MLLPPILFVGSPGCGKTTFAKSFSKILFNDSVSKVELGNDIASFTLLGSDSGFRKAKPGTILESMYSTGFSPINNPMVILDEFDKIKKNQYSSESIFNSLLEKSNSESFIDKFFHTSVNASKVNYIAICNTLNNISPSILNRFKVFKIRDYTKVEILEYVIPNIYKAWRLEQSLRLDRIPLNLSVKIKKRILKKTKGNIRDIKNALNDLLNDTMHMDKKTGIMISLFTLKERSRWQKLTVEKIREKLLLTYNHS